MSEGSGISRGRSVEVLSSDRHRVIELEVFESPHTESVYDIDTKILTNPAFIMPKDLWCP